MKNLSSRGTKIVAGLAIACAVATAQSATAPSSVQRPGAAASSLNGTLADCGVPQVILGKTNGGTISSVGIKDRAVAGHVWSCIPPYETPVYSKPGDDSVAFGSLLEASGYSPAANTSWVGVAAGNFCGNANRQLILVQNQTPNFTVLEGPAPRLKFSPGGTTNLISLGADPWRVATAGNLDGSAQDMLIAVRKVTADGVPDLMLAKLTTCSCSVLDQVSGKCEMPTIVATAIIGDRVNSDWVGAAVGNFDGTGKQIALLKTAHSNIFLIKLTQPGNSLKVVYTDDLPKDGSRDSAWKAMAAGDIDGDGKDELIVARQESDNISPTVFVYKWNTEVGAFRIFAASNFGNNGNSNWSSATAGDFNADGRQAVVLVKDKHSNFALIDLPAGTNQLRILATNDLNSDEGQTWTGVAATDWMAGDEGAAELVAVRAVHSPDRTNVFVYGNPFHRVLQNSALASTKSQWSKWPSIPDLKTWIRSTNTDTFLWLLRDKGDYPNLVQFLHDTADWGVNGKQLRVWLTLVPPRYVTTKNGAPGTYCSQPEATPGLTTWNALDFFQNDFGGSGSPDDKTIAACKDMLAWATTAGRLAQDFPHLVGVAIDDFSEQLDQPFKPDTIAAMESNMRTQAPWMNLAPFIYYPQFRNSNWKDLVLTLDSMVFFFRNDKRGQCIGPTPACDATLNNVPDEVADMSQLQPLGRKMLHGEYWVGLSSQGGIPPTIAYDYKLTRMALENPSVGSAVAYGLQTPGISCDGVNFLQDRFCALREAYGTDLAIAPPTISFPQTFVGEVSTRAVAITNVGGSTVTVTIPASPPPVTTTYYWNSGDFVVAPGQAIRLLINFSPKAVGTSQQTITLTGNALGSPYSVRVNGTGVGGFPR